MEVNTRSATPVESLTSSLPVAIWIHQIASAWRPDASLDVAWQLTRGPLHFSKICSAGGGTRYFITHHPTLDIVTYEFILFHGL